MAEPAFDITPVELRVREGGRVLRLSYPGGMRVDIDADRLRAASPSADTRPAPGAVTIVDVEPIGNYAARFSFSDGHATGIFSWVLLWALAEGGGGGPPH